MTAYLKYLSYVLRHKWFVFLSCCRMGIPWQGIIHDISKFYPWQWFPYVHAFYGKKPNPRDNSGYYDAAKIGNDPFLIAWLDHIHRNKHHWQWWVLQHDDGGKSVFDMPLKYRREMLADWIGAGRAQGKPDTKAWYEANKDKMQLHPETRKWIEMVLGVTQEK